MNKQVNKYKTRKIYKGMRDEHFVPRAVWVEGEAHAQSGPMKKNWANES